jgi:hypothetical protein
VSKKAKKVKAKSKVKETPEQKETRYLKQNGGGPLTDKQLKRLGRPLGEQHAAIRKEEPLNTGATGAPTRVSQDELVDMILTGGPDRVERFRRGETFRIDTSHTDKHAADKDLESARSRITRYARKHGLQYSTQKQHDGQGDRFLAVHLSV